MTFLRPHHIVPAGDWVWLVDQLCPAAVVVRPDGSIERRVWDGEPDEDDRRIVVDQADHGGIVVQDGDILTWLHADGTTRSMGGASELELAAADITGAWLVDGGGPEPPFPGNDLASEQFEPGLIVVIAPDGARAEIATHRPVSGLSVEATTVTVLFADVPTLQEREVHTAVAYPVSSLAIPRDLLLAGGGLDGDPVLVPGTDAPDIERFDVADDLRWAWLETDAARVLAGGERLGDHLWWFGAERNGSAIDRRVLVNAYDPATGALRRCLDAGFGMVDTVRRVADELWFVVLRAQLLRVGRDDGVEVLALAADGTLHTVLAPDSIDIGDTAPPLVARPGDAEIAARIAEEREKFTRLENFWRDENGGTHPLSDGLTDSDVVVEGDWPELSLLVRLRHPMRPGLLLQRRLALYDRRGRPVETGFADIEIMEDLDTDYLPPAENAVDGVLEF